jgi:hypothetical protein
MMESHEWARKVIEKANEVLAAPSFNMPNYQSELDNLTYYYDKDGFVAAVRALGAGAKDATDEKYFRFKPDALPTITLQIEREQICKMVKPPVYDCGESLLEEAEKAVDKVSDIPF